MTLPTTPKMNIMDGMVGTMVLPVIDWLFMVEPERRARKADRLVFVKSEKLGQTQKHLQKRFAPCGRSCKRLRRWLGVRFAAALVESTPRDGELEAAADFIQDSAFQLPAGWCPSPSPPPAPPGVTLALSRWQTPKEKGFVGTTETATRGRKWTHWTGLVIRYSIFLGNNK